MGLKERLKAAKTKVREIRDDFEESARLQHQRELDRLAAEQAKIEAKAKKSEELAEAREKVLAAKRRLAKAKVSAEEAKKPKPQLRPKITPRREALPRSRVPRITPKVGRLK